MKTLVQIPLAFLSLLPCLHAAPITLFNTAVDASGTPLLGGAPDAHWMLVSGPGISSPTPAAVLDNQVLGNYAESPFSRWIWVEADGTAAFNAPYTFRLTFDLTGFDPGTATITGRWAADNEGLILLNGSSAGIGTGVLSLSGIVDSHFQTFHDFTLNGGFNSGINTLDFVINDLGIIGGLNVTELRGMVAVPEPASITLCALGVFALLIRLTVTNYKAKRRNQPAA